jgi:hypothetical protein
VPSGTGDGVETNGINDLSAKQKGNERGEKSDSHWGAGWGKDVKRVKDTPKEVDDPFYQERGSGRDTRPAKYWRK